VKHVPWNRQQPRPLLAPKFGRFSGRRFGLLHLYALNVSPQALVAHLHLLRSGVTLFGGLGCESCLRASHLVSISFAASRMADCGLAVAHSFTIREPSALKVRTRSACTPAQPGHSAAHPARLHERVSTLRRFGASPATNWCAHCRRIAREIDRRRRSSMPLRPDSTNKCGPPSILRRM
jgi:hypothetical protein